MPEITVIQETIVNTTMKKEKESLRVLPCTDSLVHVPLYRGLSEAPGIELLPLAKPSMLLPRARRDHPDVIVIATERLQSPAWPAETQLREILSSVPSLSDSVVLLAAESDLTARRRAERLAIHTVLPFDITAPRLVAAVYAAYVGLAVSLPAFNPAQAGDLEAGFDDDLHALVSAEIPDQLTPREVEVLRLMALGLGNKQVAARLEISDHTAKFHVSQILAKMGAASRTEAVSLGITHGIVAI